ncbi:MAG: GH116 family glycosyl-hydrolase, partial [Nocardioidaceae bacterium]
MAGGDSGCCSDGTCEPEPVAGPGGLTRRTFLSLSAAGVTSAMLASRAEAAEALGTSEDDLVLVPADKGLDPDWVASLTERGEPTVYAGADLTYIGMPVGGGCSGQLYLGGDGQLWRWDVYNGQARATSDRAYAHPPEPHSPFGQGFVLRTRTHEGESVRTLDSDGFDSVSFTGQYPIGVVDYRDKQSPVRVRLEAFSPFVPLDVEASTLPATVLAYTLHNTGSTPVRADLLGWSRSPVCLDSRNAQPITLTSDVSHGRVRGAQFGAKERDLGEPRKDIVLEGWEHDDYSGWTVDGDAFGSGPVLETDLPDYMRRFGDLHVEGKRLVTSHRFEDDDTGQADAHTGSLTSKPFTVERRYLQALVGGGSAVGETCVQVLVDGSVVGTVTGDDTEPLARRSIDLSRYEGKRATIRIVDAATDGWGHVNVDTLTLSDKPADPKPLSELPDHGTFAVAALTGHGVHATVRPSIGEWSTPAELFTAPDGPDEVDGGRATLTGTVTASVEVPPGGSRTVRF